MNNNNLLPNQNNNSQFTPPPARGGRHQATGSNERSQQANANADKSELAQDLTLPRTNKEGVGDIGGQDNGNQESQLNRQKYEASRQKQKEAAEAAEKNDEAEQKEKAGAAKAGAGLAMRGGGQALKAGGTVTEKAGGAVGDVAGSMGGAAIGATGGAIGGAITGGIAGLAAGGIGAIPGALAGAGEGVMSGAKTGQKFGGKIGGVVGGLPGKAMKKTGQSLDVMGQRMTRRGSSTFMEGALEKTKNKALNALGRAKNNQPESGIPAPQAVNQIKEFVSFLKSFIAFINPITAALLTFWLFIEILGVKKFIKGGDEKPFSGFKLAEIIVIALADIMWLAIVTLIIIVIYKILNGEFGFWTLIKAILRGVRALMPGGQSPTEAVIDSLGKSAVQSIVPE
ncbi:hypothetical protein HZA71_01410 [Candidatus Falkowbacteria bacterium]|nr:hypothetical protein [Candidatus Falkowbacteria bacterium]